MPTQLERRTEAQHAIVDAALELFVENDSADVSLDAVAERAGLAKSTVLYHFNSRIGLLDAVADRLFHEMGARLTPIDRYPDAPAFVRAFLNDVRSPGVRIFHMVSDQLRYTSDRRMGRGIEALVEALELLGVTDRAWVIAAATMTMARQVTFGDVTRAEVDRFVDELFRGWSR